MGRRYLTTGEVAKRLRASESTIRYWRMTGYLPVGTAFGRRVLYDEQDLDAWEQERKAQEGSGRSGDAA